MLPSGAISQSLLQTGERNLTVGLSQDVEALPSEVFGVPIRRDYGVIPCSS